MYNYTEMFCFRLIMTYFIFIGKGLPGDSGPSGAKGGQVRRDSDKNFINLLNFETFYRDRYIYSPQGSN